MFGTGRRGQASGLLSLTAVAGSALGLLICGDLSERFNSFRDAFAILAIGPLLVVLIVYFFFPESANQELEDLNPDDRP
jgi:MFS family permease